MRIYCFVFIILYSLVIRAETLVSSCEDLVGQEEVIKAGFNPGDYNWDLGRMVNADYTYKPSGDSARFEIRSDDKQIHYGWRSEVRDPFVAPLGSKICMSFSSRILFDPDKLHTPSLVLAAWHEVVPMGDSPRRPPLTLRLVNNEFKFIFFNDEILNELGPDSQGKVLTSVRANQGEWVNWVIVARWLADEKGHLDIYANGIHLESYRGPLGYRNDPYGPYFKMGVYTVHPIPFPLITEHKNFQKFVYHEDFWEKLFFILKSYRLRIYRWLNIQL